MISTRRQLTAFLFVAACGGALLIAQSTGRPPLRSGAAAGPDCTDQLVAFVGLTETQKTALEALRTQTRQSIDTLTPQAKAAYDALETALGAARPDRCTIGDLAILAHALRQQIEAIIDDAETAFVASLTSDQQSKYATFKATNPGCAAFAGRSPAFAFPGGRAR